MKKQQIKLTDEELTKKVLENKYNCPYCNSISVVKLRSQIVNEIIHNTMKCFSCKKRWFFIPELNIAETQDYDAD